jgi:hypothetical protein
MISEPWLYWYQFRFVCFIFSTWAQYNIKYTSSNTYCEIPSDLELNYVNYAGWMWWHSNRLQTQEVVWLQQWHPLIKYYEYNQKYKKITTCPKAVSSSCWRLGTDSCEIKYGALSVFCKQECRRLLSNNWQFDFFLWVDGMKKGSGPGKKNKRNTAVNLMINSAQASAELRNDVTHDNRVAEWCHTWLHNLIASFDYVTSSRVCPPRWAGQDLLTKWGVTCLVSRLQPSHRPNWWAGCSLLTKWSCPTWLRRNLLGEKVSACSPISRSLPAHQSGNDLHVTCFTRGYLPQVPGFLFCLPLWALVWVHVSKGIFWGAGIRTHCKLSGAGGHFYQQGPAKGQIYWSTSWTFHSL